MADRKMALVGFLQARNRSNHPASCRRPESAGAYMPGAYEDFFAHVTPELQRRRLFQQDYAGATLREKLGLG